jgi:predicted lactoylglutathione lyase
VVNPPGRSGAGPAVSCESREEVDRMTDKALAMGGSPVRNADDYGFMYARNFHDPDGHIWEPL